MEPEEKIQAHLVSVWREGKKFFSIGGKKAITQRQVINFIKSKDTMIRHDGYNEEDLMNDCEDDRNIELSFDDISSVSFTEKDWGSSLQLEYHKDGKEEKFQYSIAQDWVKYPVKEPTKYMKVDWKPFVQYIKDRQKFTK